MSADPFSPRELSWRFEILQDRTDQAVRDFRDLNTRHEDLSQEQEETKSNVQLLHTKVDTMTVAFGRMQNALYACAAAIVAAAVLVVIFGR